MMFVAGAAAQAQTRVAPGQLKPGDTAMVYSIAGWRRVPIIAVRGDEYLIRYPTGEQLWVKARNLRPDPGPRQAGAGRPAPPPAADASCGAVLDGTYADAIGLLSLTFRSGRAIVTQPLAGTWEAECKIHGDRILLRGPRPQDVLTVMRRTNGALQDSDAGLLTRTERQTP